MLHSHASSIRHRFVELAKRATQILPISDRAISCNSPPSNYLLSSLKISSPPFLILVLNLKSRHIYLQTLKETENTAIVFQLNSAQVLQDKQHCHSKKHEDKFFHHLSTRTYQGRPCESSRKRRSLLFN